MSRPLFKDRLLLSGMAGLIGILPDLILEYAALITGVSHTTTGMSLAGIMFLTRHPYPGEIVMGTVAHLLSGAALGVVILLALVWFGEQWAVLKGLAIGAAFWLNHLIVVPSFVAPRIQLTRTVAESMVSLAALLAWGVTTAFIIERSGVIRAARKECG